MYQVAFFNPSITHDLTSRRLFCRTNSLNNVQCIRFIIDAIIYWIKMIIIFLWLTYKSWIEKETENFNVFDDAIRSSQCEVKWYITDDQHEFHGLKMIINFYRKYFSIPSNGNLCLSYMRKVMRPDEQVPERTRDVYIVHHLVRTPVRKGPRYMYLLLVVWGDSEGRSFGWERKILGPVLQQMWHEKGPSLLQCLY